MTALQCATTMVIARHGAAEYEAPTGVQEGGSLTHRGRQQAAALAEALASRRVAHVWTSTQPPAVQTGEIVAARLGVGVTTRLGLGEPADRFGAVLHEIADAHPGETVLVVSHGGAIETGVPDVARMQAQARRLDDCESVELLADADAWVCTRWGSPLVSQGN
jgi:probable phosphoglycerate mutase